MSSPAFRSASPAVTVSGKTYTKATVTSAAYVQLTPAVDVIYGPTRVMIFDDTTAHDFYVTQAATLPAGDTLSAYVSVTGGLATIGFPFHGTDPIWVKAVSTTVTQIVAQMAIDSTGAPAQP